MTAEQRTVLVTGGYGCIGAETTKWLLRNTEAEVVICGRRVSSERTERVFHDVDRARITAVEVDVSQRSAVEELVAAFRLTEVIHLAALQTPACNAHRDLGLQINLSGTQHLIEAIKSMPGKLSRFVFASSIAVYGPRAMYAESRVPMLAPPHPVNVYGVWKLASEHLCRLFQQDAGVPTVCLRPGVLYGPGRDAGLTATPTTAMKHLAVGRPFEIPFASAQDYLYAPDVGAAFGIAATQPYDGFGVFTLPSWTLETEQVVAAMRAAWERIGRATPFEISVGNESVPFIRDVDYEPFLEAFSGVPHTPVDEAIEASLRVFLEQAERGWLKLEPADA